ncbi:hypothetical protein PFMG_03507, partial [Plasmodium falciparum IGH-CR14]
MLLHQNLRKEGNNIFFYLNKENGKNIFRRYVASQPLGINIPDPPPREYLPNGEPKTYRLNQRYYNHKYDWERWTLRPAGVFHTYVYGEFAKDHKPLLAWLLQYPIPLAFIPYFLFAFGLSFAFHHISYLVIKPKRFTVECVEANKERERAENTNPITRYLDRRRKERGPHCILEDFLPSHPCYLHMSKYHHDTELLRNMEEVAAEKEQK